MFLNPLIFAANIISYNIMKAGLSRNDRKIKSLQQIQVKDMDRV